MRALEWERAGQDRSFLLQGTDLQQAENWLVESVDKEPEPTLKQTRYIQSSRQDASKKQRRLLLSIGAALIVTIVLGVVAVINGQRAEQQRGIAEQNAYNLATQVVVAEEQKEIAEENARLAHIRELTAISQLNSTRFDIAMLLGVESFKTIDNYQTRNNLYKLGFLNPQVSRISNHEGVQRISFSPDGKLLASASGDEGSIILWDSNSGQPIGEPLVSYRDMDIPIDFSPIGKTLAYGGYDKIIFLDLATMESTHVDIIGIEVIRITYSPDGKILAISSNNTIILLDTITLQPIGNRLYGFNGWAGNVAFSPDGKRIAYAIYPEGIRIWDIESAQPIGEPLLGHEMSLMYVTFSPDGKILASGSEDGAIILWDMENMQPIGEPLRAHTNGVTSIAFSPDGSILAVGNWDRTISLWDVASRQLIREPFSVHVGRITDIAFNSDGTILASCGEDDTVIFWDLYGSEYTMEIESTEDSYFPNGSISPDGEHYISVSENGIINLLDVATGHPFGNTLDGHTDRIVKTAFSSDSKILATVGEESELYVWDTTSGLPIAGPLQDFYCGVDRSCLDLPLAFSPDGNYLAVGELGEDGSAYLWEITNGQSISDPLQDHISNITSLAFSPDGKILAAGFDLGIYLWDVTSRQMLSYPLYGNHVDWVMSVAFSPDGKILASGDRAGNIILWNINELQPIGDPMRGYLDGIISITYDPNGETLVAGYTNGAILLWDIASRQSLGDPLIGHTNWVTSLSFRSDGKTLVSGGDSGEIFLWDIDIDTLRNKICEKAGHNFTQEEWAFYFPGEPYRKTCEQWPEGK
jgi:WD40 repeat protein